MSTWTTNGKTTTDKEALGETQVGDAHILTYNAPDRPDERVTVTFGVVLNRANRYSGEILIEHQVFQNNDWDIAPGATPTYEDAAFLQDHSSIAAACRDRDDAIRNWERQSFTDAEMKIN